MLIGSGCGVPAVMASRTIEQERDPRNSDTSLRDVKASVDYLKSVGYEI